MITSFSHIYHRVRDVDQSIEFYTKNLGFDLLRKYRDRVSGRESAYLCLGDVLLELTLAGDPSQLPREPGERRFGLTVTDIDAMVKELRSKGVEISEEPRPARTFWGRQGAIVDPSGWGIALREWRAPDGPRFDGWQPTSDVMERIL